MKVCVLRCIFRRDGGRQVDTGTYGAGKLERLRLSGLALQRQMRRRVEDRKLHLPNTCAPASERNTEHLPPGPGQQPAQPLKARAPYLKNVLSAELVEKQLQPWLKERDWHWHRGTFDRANAPSSPCAKLASQDATRHHARDAACSKHGLLEGHGDSPLDWGQGNPG